MKEDKQKEFTHVLGMAKSCLDLKGAKSAKVELDFLRLIYCIEKLRKEGKNAYGYIAIVQGLKKNIENWVEKYEIDIYQKHFDIIIVDLNKDIEGLILEKENNSKANTRHNDKSIDKKLASGSKGKSIFEERLSEGIFRKHSKVIKIDKRNELPFKIRWDFYGKY